MIHNTKTLNKYIIKEFTQTLIIIIGIFFSLLILTGLVEEIISFKDTINKNLFLKSSVFTLLKIPSQLINFLPFIFLFSGIFFFVKLIRRNELSPIKLAGLSNYYLVSVTGLYAFLLGFFIIALISPLTSSLTKYYEMKKQPYNNSDNIIVFASTGLWLKETNEKSKHVIIRADKIFENNFQKLNNVSIFNFDSEWNLIDRIESKIANIKNYTWELIDAKIIDNNPKKKIFKNFIYTSSINIADVKNYFSNPNAYSIWNILAEIEKLKSRGYVAQDFIVKFNKFLSLPFLLLAMIILSTLFTLNLKNKYSNFTYVFYGIFTGIIVHYLSDLSISLGKANKVPLVFSVWIPVFIIVAISTYNLIIKNEKI